MDGDEHPWVRDARSCKELYQDVEPPSLPCSDGLGWRWLALPAVILLLAISFWLTFLRPSPPKSQSPTPHITLWHASRPDEGILLGTWARQYEKQTGVRVDVQFQNDIPSNFIGAIFSHRAPSIAVMDMELAERLALAGALEPLNADMKSIFSLPLATPANWIRPLVLVLPKGGPCQDEARGFLTHISQQVAK